MPNPKPKYSKEDIIKQVMNPLKNGLHLAESKASGSYNASNGNALGKYQIMASLHWPKIRSFGKNNGWGDIGPDTPENRQKFLKGKDFGSAFQEDFFEKYWVPEVLYPDAIKSYEKYGKKYGYSVDEVFALTHHLGGGGANNVLKDGTINTPTHKGNPSPKEYIEERYRPGVSSSDRVLPSKTMTNIEKDLAFGEWDKQRRSILSDKNISDDVKALKIDQLNQKAWEDGTIDAVNEKAQYWNSIYEETSRNGAKNLNHFMGFLNYVNSEGNDYWGNPESEYDFGGNLTIKDQEIRNKYKDILEKYPDIIKKKTTGYYGKEDGPGSSITINKAKLLESLQKEYNQYLGPDDKLEFVKVKDGKLIKGKDFKTQEGLLSDSKSLIISTDFQNKVNPEIVYNQYKIPLIQKSPDWVTEAEIEEQAQESSNSGTDSGSGNNSQNTTVQKEIVEDKKKEPDTSFSDAFFGLEMDYNPQAPEGDIEYKQPDIPWAEAGAALYGIITGSRAADEELPQRDEKVGDAMIQYTQELYKISQQGLTPEEEAYAKKNLSESYALGLDSIIRASGGNRNVVLGNLGRLDSQMVSGMMDLSLIDVQKKQEALFKYGEAVKYIDEVDLNREIENNQRLYENAVATKEAGANLMANGFKSLLDNIQYYKENAPGSANYALKSFYNKEVFGYDPNIKDNGLGDTPGTLSYLRKQDEEMKKKVTGHNDSAEKYSALPMESKVMVNEFMQKTNGNPELNYKFINELYKNGGMPPGEVDYTKLTEAQQTGDLSKLFKSLNPTPSDIQNEENGINTFSADNGLGNVTMTPEQFGANYDPFGERRVPMPKLNAYQDEKTNQLLTEWEAQKPIINKLNQDSSEVIRKQEDQQKWLQEQIMEAQKRNNELITQTSGL